MTDMSPEAQQDLAAMYSPEPAVLNLDETAESDAAILEAARAVLQRRFKLFTSDMQQGLAMAAQYILLTETDKSPV